MRAVKTVISAAGNLKRASPEENEEALLLRALQVAYTPQTRRCIVECDTEVVMHSTLLQHHLHLQRSTCAHFGQIFKVAFNTQQERCLRSNLNSRTRKIAHAQESALSAD